MASLSAQITAAGIVAPSYADILEQLRIAFWGIYGSDANLDPDSQDGQFLAVIAKIIDDENQTCIAVYNSFSPATAQGAGLSSVVKINRLARQVPSTGSVVVTVVGVVGTIITDGIVGDNLNLGTQWELPSPTTIPVGGEIDVTAVCTVAGAIGAPAGSITKILTPTLGWQTVTNANAAAAGSPVESDAALRRRQTGSTAKGAQTVLEALFAEVDALGGVSRLSIVENDTDATNSEGVPEHSIAVVAKGGDATDIATAIANKKAPGTGTYGSITQIIFDQNNVPVTIHFFPLTEVIITVAITIQTFPGYTSLIGDTIKQSVAAFLSTLDIGEDSYLARLYSPANLGGSGSGATFVITSLTQSRAGPPLVQDVAIAFNEAAICDVTNVALTVI